MRLWIDTDVGDDPDDAVALLCAATHPAVDLVGVSTTGGNTEWRAEVVRELVDAPVVPGERPDGLVARFRAAAPDAVLAIGPLTNIAALVTLGVAVPRLTVMGGVLAPLRHRGRVRAVEHNFGANPAAAAVVVGGTDAVLVPLDATVGMRLAPADLARLLAGVPRLVPHVELWVARQDDAGVPADEIALVLHDPLALLVSVGEAPVRVERRSLLVDPASGTLREDGDGRVHGVATGLDERSAALAIERVCTLLAAST